MTRDQLQDEGAKIACVLLGALICLSIIFSQSAPALPTQVPWTDPEPVKDIEVVEEPLLILQSMPFPREVYAEADEGTLRVVRDDKILFTVYDKLGCQGHVEPSHICACENK